MPAIGQALSTQQLCIQLLNGHAGSLWPAVASKPINSMPRRILLITK